MRGLHVYNLNEGSGPRLKTGQWALHPTIRGRYLGTVAKGWWRLGPAGYTQHLEVELALGGEHSMLQLAIELPFLLHLAVGVRVPRWAIKGWVYERRSWGLKVGYVGAWLDLLFASDEHMRETGMVEYYRKRRQRPDCECHHAAEWHANPAIVWKSVHVPGEDTRVEIANPEGRCVTPAEVTHGSPPCECRGFRLASLPWSRAALWPGWHGRLRPRLRDRALGKLEHSEDELRVVETVIPMPEGNYPATVRLTRAMWRRRRWPLSRRVVLRGHVEMKVPIPVPGKGENSWDIDDDAHYGVTCPARSVSEAVSAVAQGALRDRERYAGPNWRPAGGWAEEVTR